MERECADDFTEEVCISRFSTLKEVMTKYDSLDKPQKTFNLDETGSNDKTKGKWLTRCHIILLFFLGEWVNVNSNCRRVVESSGGTVKNYNIVLIAVNAAGFVLAPFILFSGKNLMDP